MEMNNRSDLDQEWIGAYRILDKRWVGSFAAYKGTSVTGIELSNGVNDDNETQPRSG